MNGSNNEGGKLQILADSSKCVLFIYVIWNRISGNAIIDKFQASGSSIVVWNPWKEMDLLSSAHKS